MPLLPRTAWVPLLSGMIASAALTGVIGWRLNLQGLDGQIEEKEASLKKLVLSGGIPPNQEVTDYLNTRQALFDQRYQHWMKLVASPAMSEAAKTDPQLYFQEQFHEVQQKVQRLAAARSMPVPEQLGFPKGLPPSDTVPRLLAQLALIQEASTLILEQGVTALTSLKVEDPEPVPEAEGMTSFLTRLPVRVRLTSTLPELMVVLRAMERARPLIDVRAITVATASKLDLLDVELLLSRYLVMAAVQESSAEQPVPSSTPSKEKQLKPTGNEPKDRGQRVKGRRSGTAR